MVLTVGSTNIAFDEQTKSNHMNSNNHSVEAVVEYVRAL